MLSKATESQLDSIIALAKELGVVLPEKGWTEYAAKLSRKLSECGEALNRESREDGMFEAFRDAWITTENGHKIHIGEEGDPDKGNPHVLESIKGAIDRKEAEESEKKAEAEKRRAKIKVRAEHPRKGDMVCEDKVTFDNANTMSKDKYGRTITHFNHDEDTMKVTSQIPVSDGTGTGYKICRGEIEHLTIFAADGVGRGLDAANGLADQVGGAAASWKHVKGIGTVVGKDGVQRKADLHWFESPEAGQLEWKIKYFLEDMDESQIYW